jgi:hypothetical protein
MYISTPAATTTFDLLQNIHIARTTLATLVENDIALGRNGIGSWTSFHTGALEGLGGFESLFAGGGVLGGLAGCLGAGGCDFAASLLVKRILRGGPREKGTTYEGS